MCFKISRLYIHFNNYVFPDFQSKTLKALMYDAQFKRLDQNCALAAMLAAILNFARNDLVLWVAYVAER